jgi:hypothetical protein
MKQRVPRSSWSSPGLAGRRPRLLIEDDRPALAISDFTLFRDAGLDVAFCSGPGDDPAACPLMEGQRCALVDRADVVLHGLSPGLGIATAIRRQRPELPVLVEQTCQPDGTVEPVPAGCLPLPCLCSVRGQADAVLRAAAGARDGRARRSAPPPATAAGPGASDHDS